MLVGASIIIIINVIIQTLVCTIWLRRVTPILKGSNDISNTMIVWLLLISFLIFTLLHVGHAMVWAGFYYFYPSSTLFGSFSEALYFSLVTLTTLGYGDITLTPEWRLLSGLQAINGIMLIGWSTAMMYSLIQHIYRKITENNAET